MQLEKLIDKEKFFAMSNMDLERLTGIPNPRWSEWWKGRWIGEEKLTEIGACFGQTPGTVLDWIIERRNVKPDSKESWASKHSVKS